MLFINIVGLFLTATGALFLYWNTRSKKLKENVLADGSIVYCEEGSSAADVEFAKDASIKVFKQYNSRNKIGYLAILIGTLIQIAYCIMQN